MITYEEYFHIIIKHIRAKDALEALNKLIEERDQSTRLREVLFEVIEDDQYGSPDSGNDEGIEKAMKLIGWKPWNDREDKNGTT